MRLPMEVINQLLGDKDFLGSLTNLIKAITGLVNWALVVFVITQSYKAILEIVSWFR